MADYGGSKSKIENHRKCVLSKLEKVPYKLNCDDKIYQGALEFYQENRNAE